jgi:hypothetical protein
MNDFDRSPRVVVFSQGGAYRSCRITPDKYVAARFVSELADAWKAYAETGSLSTRSVIMQASVIRSAADFLDSESDRFLTMEGDTAALAHRLHDWESAMVLKFPPPSVRAKDLGMLLRNNVARFLESKDIEGGVLAAWANSLVLDGRPSEAVPLDEFSNDERLQLEHACRNIIRAAEERLVRGDEFLRQGRDPRKHGWDQLENLLWAMRYLPYEETFCAHLAGRRRQLDPYDIERISGVQQPTGGDRRPLLLRAAGAFLAPDAEFLLAIRVLLHLQTGWAPEESTTLKLADIEFGNSSVRVKATKLRASRIRWYTLTSPQDGPWGWKAGDLLRRAHHAMRHARALAPDEDLFWLASISAARDRRPTEYPSYVMRAQNFNQPNTLNALIRRHGLSISQPHDMRRLRKTVKSARAALLGTLSGAAGDDQSIEVFRGHYAQTTTVHTIAAQTVLRAQGKVLDRAKNGPALINVSASEVGKIDNDPELAQLASHVANETDVEQQLTLAACRNPYDAPFMASGSLCHASPSMCLQCRNAVVFRDHLPRLVVYREALDAIEKDLSPIVFSEVYGQQRVNLDAIIAEFPEQDVAVAREQDVTLHRSLGQRAEL